MPEFSFNLFANRTRRRTKQGRSNLRRGRLAGEQLEGRNLLATVTVDFSDLSLDPASHWNGPDPQGSNEPDPFGGSLPVVVGSFRSGNVAFSNSYNTNYDSWAGFGYSNENDTETPGFVNQFSSFAGGGLGDEIFGVASGYLDEATFDPADASQLAELPNITLPPGVGIESAFVTNTTYAALSMRDGDGFAKRFGGDSGDDPDWFKLTAYGTDDAGAVVAAAPEIYLADYRNADNTQDFILDVWTQLDLSALAGARRVYFNLNSSDVGSFGMNTPAFFAIDNISFSNTAPALDAASSPQLTPIEEDAVDVPGALVSSLLADAVTDSDPSAVQGMAVVGTSAGGGQWQYTLNGSTWQEIGAASETEALLLPSDSATRVRFVPDADSSGSFTINYRAWDQTQGTAGEVLNTAGRIGGAGTFSTDIVTAPQDVLAVNDAPVLDTAYTPSLGAIWEDAKNPTGTLVKYLTNPAMSDVDSDAIKGVGVIRAWTGNGQWQYSLDSATWQSMGDVSESAARLLPADATTRVRFIPRADYNGAAWLTFRGWDRTEGTAGDTLNTAERMGSTQCFSLESDAARITIKPVNDAPVLDPAPTRTFGAIREDAKNPTGTLLKYLVRTGLTDVDQDSLPGIAVTSAWTGKGLWQFSTGSVTPNWRAVGEVSESAARLLPVDDTTRIRFVPKPNFNGQAWIRFRGWDQTGQEAAGGVQSTLNTRGGTQTFSLKDDAASITVKPINDAPVLSLSGTIGYVHDKPPIVLAPFAKVTDVDSPNFAGGELKIRIASGRSNSNLIELGAGFTVDDDFQVRQETTIIGTLNPGGGVGTTDLVVTFHNTATKSMVQQLVRSITFRTIGGIAGTRVVKFSVSDGDLGISGEASKTVNVT